MRPVDRSSRRLQFGPVKKKPAMASEAAAPYAAKKAGKGKVIPKAESGVRYLDSETAQKLTKDIFDKHHDLFRKLAQ